MGLIKGALKVVGTVALTATGIAAGAGKLFFEIAGGNELASDVADLFGKGQDASFNAIRNMWDNGEHSEVFDTLDEKRQNANINASEVARKRLADTAKQMAETAKKNGDMEKYEKYMEQYNNYR